MVELAKDNGPMNNLSGFSKKGKGAEGNSATTTSKTA
jgi:hypothetical protein